jgi:hypothetical protein
VRHFMLKPLNILFCLTLSFSVKGQNPDSTIISNLQKLFSDIKGSTYLTSQPLIVDSPYQVNIKAIEKIASLDSIFSTDDLAFIEDQMNQSKRFEWNSVLIDSASFISTGSLDSLFKANRKDGSLGWTSFRKLKKTSGFYKISFPCFSKDRQYCVVYISYYCGMACGEGGLKIYKFQLGKWVLYKSWVSWVS